MFQKLKEVTTPSPTTTASQKITTPTTTTPVKPAAVTTTLPSTSTTMTKSTATTSSPSTLTIVKATATTPPRMKETIQTQQTTDPIVFTTIQQTSTSLPKCNHTCTLDAVILTIAVTNSKADNCSITKSASNQALPMECCNMGDPQRWSQGAQVQTNMMCTDGIPPPYTPIAAYNGTDLIPGSAGIFYGCIKNGHSGFMMVHQACDRLPQLLHVDSTAGKDPNSFHIIY